MITPNVINPVSYGYSQPRPMKPVPATQIPPRGHRSHRKPKENLISKKKTTEANCPVLNEMIAFDIYMYHSELQKNKFEDKNIESFNNRRIRASKQFFEYILSPPESLYMPEIPEVAEFDLLTPHSDYSFQTIPASVFQVKKLDITDDIPQDISPFVMKEDD